MNYQKIVIILGFTTVGCLLSVIIFTQPVFTSYLNLTDKANIGDALSGLTAPFLGVISSILLYLALTSQTEANREHRLKNESDVIFLLLNQLDNELSSFYFTFQVNNVEKSVFGLEGLYKYSRMYRYELYPSFFRDEPEACFKDWYESGQIVLIVDTFNLVENRIRSSNLSDELKNMFLSKLESFYVCKLKIALEELDEAFGMYESQKDVYTEKIQILVSKFRSRY